MKNSSENTAPMSDAAARRQAIAVDELTQRNIETIVAMESAAKAERTRTDVFAEVVTHFCGSMRFIWAHIVILAAWSVWNVLPSLKPWRFDEFPFFFMCFILAVEAIFLASFILMNQRHESRLSEQRNHLDLQINLLSEQENTKMLQMLSQIAKAVGVTNENDQEIHVLQAAARPDKMMEQIKQTIEQSNEQNEETESAPETPEAA